VPFKLSLYGVSGVDDFDLQIVTQPSIQTPRQDFQFSDLDASSVRGSYCVEGELRKPGAGLRDCLTIAAILYNAQG
jgi:hypothetical protein